MRAWSGMLVVLVGGLACDEQFTSRDEAAAGASGTPAGAGRSGAEGAAPSGGGHAGEGAASGGGGAASGGGGAASDGGAWSGGAAGLAGAGHAGAATGTGGSAGEGGSGPGGCPELLADGGFENSPSAWQAASTTGRQLLYAEPADELVIAPRSGSALAWLGAGAEDMSALSQPVTIPLDVETLTFSGFVWISSEESPGEGIFDVTHAELTLGPAVALASPDWSNEDETIGWQAFELALDVAEFRGREMTFRLYSRTDAELVTHFWYDELSLRACAP